jgi:arsenite transporter
VGRLFFKRDDAIAMVFGVVMRNLSIALAIAMTAFGRQGVTIALLISLTYVVQIQSAAWYVRLVEKIFGKSLEKQNFPQGRRVEKKAVTVARPVTPIPQPGASVVPDFKRILYATDLSDKLKNRHSGANEP